MFSSLIKCDGYSDMRAEHTINASLMANNTKEFDVKIKIKNKNNFTDSTYFFSPYDKIKWNIVGTMTKLLDNTFTSL